MKNIRKKITWLSLATFLMMPIGLAISCAKGKEETKYVFPMPNLKGAENLKFANADLSAFKNAAIKKGITKEKIDEITLKDLQDYRLNADGQNANKKALIKTLDDLLLSFSFEKNLDGQVMGGLQKWLNNANLQIYNVQDPNSGPWRSQEAQGTSSYYRKDLLELRNFLKLNTPDFVGSKFVNGANFKSERFINRFGTPKKTKKGDRLFDDTMAILNKFSGYTGSSTSFSIYRSETSGKYNYDIEELTGRKKWTSEVKEKTSLFGGLDIKINNASPSDSTYKTAFKLAEKQNKDNTDILFETKSNKTVTYGKAENGNVVDSNINFKARDLFYGFVRSLYASKEVRNEGKINGIDISAFVDKFTEEQKTKWDDQFASIDASNAFNNGNTYIYDLYGIDIAETLQANIDKNDENKFVLKFNKFKPTSLEFFKDVSFINPFSKELLSNAAKKEGKITKFNPDKLSVFTYGKPYKGSGAIDTDGFLSLAPFIYTNYSTTASEYITIKQNVAYVDQTWVNDGLSIKGYREEINKSNLDASVNSAARLRQFQNAETTQEYILDDSVLNFKSLLKKITNYKVYKKPNRNSNIGYKLSWNFYGFNDKSYNALGKKMMWGIDENIENDPSALKEFFYGSGSKTRASIKAAINWYAMAQTLFPGLNKEFYPSISHDNEFTASNVDKALAFPKYLQPTSELKTIYDSNIQDLYKAWTPNTVASAAKTLDEVATKAGATEKKPAQIGIFRYMFNDKPITPQQLQTGQIILGRLNSLTKKVKFVNQQKYNHGDFKIKARNEKNLATLLHSYGPDYVGLGSINQQYLTTYVTFGVVPFFKASFES